MDASRWERVGAASGIVFVGLMIAALSVVPVEPKHSELDRLVTYFGENRTGLLLQAYLAGLASFFLLWFGGSVRTHIQRNEGGAGRLASIAFSGAVVAAGLMLVGAVLYATAAFRANQALDPALLRLLTDAGTFAFTFAFVPLAVWIGATAIASYRSVAFPRWHAIAGAVFAVVFAAVPASIFAETGFFSTDQWAAPGTALTAALAWVLATSVMLIVGEAAKVEATEQPHENWHLRRAASQ